MYTVEPGGSATMIAGVRILFEPGTHAKNGGYLHGYISTTDHCGVKEPAIVTTPAGEGEKPVITGDAAFRLYPNPTAGNFTLEQTKGSIFGLVAIEIYSMPGEKVITARMEGERKHEFRLGDLPPGLYFVKIAADGFVDTFKLVKTR